MKKKAIIITACVIAAFLAITGSIAAFYAIKRNTLVEFEYTVPKYTGSLRGESFEAAFSKYGSRTEPQKVYVSKTEELGLNDIPTEPINIYRYRHAYYLKYVYGEESLYDFEELKLFSERIIPNVVNVINVKDGAAEEKHEPSRNRITVDIEKYSIDIEQYSFYHEVVIRKSHNFKNIKPVIVLNGEQVMFPTDLSDEEIIKAMEKHEETLFSVFGRTFENVKVVRHISENEKAKNTVAVYYYNETDSPLNQYAPVRNNATFEEHDSIGFYSDYITVFFTYDSSDKDALSTLIKYTELRAPTTDVFPLAYISSVIPLQSAEGMLFNNQFFSGNVCVLCAGEDIKITEYDYVSFEYLAGDGFRNDYDTYVLPFYVFYVKEETGGKYDTYSKYYVPAVRFLSDYYYWTDPYDYYYEAHLQHKTEESEEDVYG